MLITVTTLDTVITWVAAIATLAILSVVYRENPFYRFFEHLFIGVATGYGVFVTWRDALSDTWWQPLSQGAWYWVIAPLVAMLFYTVYVPKYAWLSRFVISVMFGLSAGTAFKAFANQVWPQVTSSFLTIRPDQAAGLSVWGALSNLVFMLTLVAVMFYFFFAFRHRNPAVTRLSQGGRWLLMIAFGATFGSTVMARFSLLIDRLQFLLIDWLHIR